MMSNAEIVLRDYQKQGVEQIRNSYARGNKAPLYVLPTGGGKAIVLSYIASQAALKGKVIYILAHRIELVDQLSLTMRKFNADHEIITAKRKFPSTQKKIYIASVQTLARRLNYPFPKPDLIVIDEGHHLIAGNTWGQVIEHFHDSRLLIVTATPSRLSGEGLGKGRGGYADDLIIGPTTAELIEMGMLCKYKYYAPSKPDLTNIKTIQGDYEQTQLANTMSQPSIVGDVVEHYQKYLKGKRALVFGVTIDHINILKRAFNEAGILAETIEGTMETSHRTFLINKFINYEIQVLLNVNLVTEGFDLPELDAVIVARATQSLSLFRQIVGRVLRIAKGKELAIILDHGSNYERHGLPDDEITWSLDSPKKKRKSTDKLESIKRCEVCFTVNKVANQYCEECKAPLFKETEKKEIEHVDGELVEITARTERKNLQSLQDLISYGKIKGYKPQWAYYVYKSRSSKK